MGECAVLRVMVGHEPRVAIQTNVTISSLYERSSVALAITPLVLAQLPIDRRGLTEFSFARFLTPWLCEYSGWALFLDSDVILNCDVGVLFKHALEDGGDKAVYVPDVKPDFEKAAVMLFRCDHPDNKKLTPDYIDTTQDYLHLLRWTQSIGFLPMNANHCVGYAKPQDLEKIQVLHYTCGVPVWPETADCEHAEEWHKARRQMCSVKTSWPDLIGKSVHSRPGPEGKPLPRWKVQDGTLDEG